MVAGALSPAQGSAGDCHPVAVDGAGCRGAGAMALVELDARPRRRR